MATRSSKEIVPAKRLKLGNRKVGRPRGCAPGRLKAFRTKGLDPSDCDFDRPIREGWLRFKINKETDAGPRCHIFYASPTLDVFFTSGPELHNWLIEYQIEPYYNGVEYRKYFCMSTIPATSYVNGTLIVEKYSEIEKIMNELKVLRSIGQDYHNNPRYVVENVPVYTPVESPELSSTNQQWEGGQRKMIEQLSGDEDDGEKEKCGSVPTSPNGVKERFSRVKSEPIENDETEDECEERAKREERDREKEKEREREREEEEKGKERERKRLLRKKNKKMKVDYPGEGGGGEVVKRLRDPSRGSLEEGGEGMQFSTAILEWGWYRFIRNRGDQKQQDVYYWPPNKDVGRTFINGPHGLRKYLESHPVETRGMSMEMFVTYFTFSRVIDVPGTLMWSDEPLESCVFLEAERSATIINRWVGKTPAEPTSSPPKAKNFIKIPTNNRVPSITAGPEARGDQLVVRKIGSDITRGKETRPIRNQNTTQNGPDQPDHFVYITKNEFAADVEINKHVSIVCECLRGCGPLSQCPCMIGQPIPGDVEAYQVYECHSLCACNAKPKGCFNRILNRGPTVDLELVYQSSVGWGVRTLSPIPKGHYVMEMVGEILPESRAFRDVELGLLTKTYMCQFYTSEPNSTNNLSRHENYPIPGEDYNNGTATVMAPTNEQRNNTSMESSQLMSGPIGMVGTLNYNNLNQPTMMPECTHEISLDNSNQCNGQDKSNTPVLLGRELARNDIKPINQPVVSSGKVVKSKNRPAPTNPMQGNASASTNGNTVQPNYHQLSGQSYVLDASRKGNVARFLNYDCKPNLRLIDVRGGSNHVRATRLVFVAIDNIYPGTELTWDYGVTSQDTLPFPLKCSCEGECVNRRPA